MDDQRVRKLNEAEDRPNGEYVLYWSQMNRRVDANHALLYAIELANRYKLPVLFYEGLTCTYQYANDRLHTFVLQNVPQTARHLEQLGIGYVFYLRKRKDSPNDILYRLAKKAAAVVSDDYPTFIARTHNSRVPEKLGLAYYAVDSSCVVPMSCLPERQYAAYTIRPRLHRLLPQFLVKPDAVKVQHRFTGKIPDFHTKVTEEGIPKLVATCEIDHSVSPALAFTGGRQQAEKLVKYFLSHNLKRYAEARNEPRLHATSHLSPYLHFGQISSLEVALAAKDFAKKHKLNADAFLEELIVRRELSFNYASHVDDPGSLRNVPQWAQQSMAKHAKDRRPKLYNSKALEQAETGDALWNATQREMLLRGKVHGYYRMYWGKKFIEWTETYEEAVRLMIEFHDRYAVDGRDPNTYTNILWCFGLHDRAWPERPIFGKLRFMSLEGMKRKTDTVGYIDEIEKMKQTGRDETVVV